MITQSESHLPLKSRKQCVEDTQRAIIRLPLIVEILDKLSKAEVPYPGDDDIRHGCERALTAMLVELAKIEPAPVGKPSKLEDAALAYLHTPSAVRLIHPDQLQRMQQFLERIFGAHRNGHH